MNFKRLIVSIFAVALLYLGNIIYYQSNQIDGPFFLKHYYDIDLNQDGFRTIDLYYVTNEQHDVWNISIPGIDYSKVVFNHVHQQFPHYEVRRVVIELDGVNVEETMTNTKINVQFSNEDIWQYDIGEITLRPSNATENGRLFGYLASGGSSDGTSFSLFEVLEPMNLVGIEYPFEHVLNEELETFVEIGNDSLKEFKEKVQTSKIDEENEAYIRDHMWKVDGLPIRNLPFPIAFEKKDTVKINNAFKFKENSASKQSVYDFALRFLFETEDGKEFFARAHINHQPYLLNRDIKELAKKVGERQ